jgi:hypothetical protein
MQPPKPPYPHTPPAEATNPNTHSYRVVPWCTDYSVVVRLDERVLTAGGCVRGKKKCWLVMQHNRWRRGECSKVEARGATDTNVTSQHTTTRASNMRARVTCSQRLTRQQRRPNPFLPTSIPNTFFCNCKQQCHYRRRHARALPRAQDFEPRGHGKENGSNRLTCKHILHRGHGKNSVPFGSEKTKKKKFRKRR